MQTIRWYRWLALGWLAVPISGRAQAPQPIVKEIAAIPGVDVDYAVMMPNGHVIIYAANDSIAAYNMTTKHITLIARGWDDDLAISAQGDRLAYSRSTDNGEATFVWTIPIDSRSGAPTGLAQRVSLNEGMSPSFSPDGKMIAYGSGEVQQDHPQDLAVLPATGGAQRVLARYQTQIGETSWSADGKWIFAQLGTDPDTARSITRVPASGGRSEVVITYSRPLNAEGSFEGQIAFYRADQTARREGRIAYRTISGAQGEFRIPVGSGTGTGLGSPSPLLVTTVRPTTVQVLSLADGKIRELSNRNVYENSFRWSPDGRKVALLLSDSAHVAPNGVVVVNADGTGQREYSAPTSGGIQWSPDARTIAFGSANHTQVGLLDLASGGTRILSFPRMSLVSMKWRSNGQAVIAEATLQAPNTTSSHLALIELGLDGTTRLLRDISAEFPAATRAVPLDDHHVLVTGPSASFNRFLVVPTDGSLALPAIAPPLEPTEVVRRVQSKDGNSVAMVVFAGGHPSSLEIFSTTGQRTRVVPLPLGGIADPIMLGVLPDLEQVIFARRTPQDTVLTFFTAPLQGGAPRAFASIPRGVTSYQIAPDGKSIGFITSGTPTSRIYLADMRPILESVIKH